MKIITGEEDFSTPIMLLFIFSMILGLQLRSLPEYFENFNKVHSVILNVPILFGDTTLETICNIGWFYFPIAILFMALKQKDLLLKITYMLGAIPLTLTNNVIINLGYKGLYIFSVAIIFVVVMLLIKYLTRTSELYKAVLRQKNR